MPLNIPWLYYDGKLVLSFFIRLKHTVVNNKTVVNERS